MGQETVICRLGWVRIFQMPGSRLRMRAAPSNSWSIALKTDPCVDAMRFLSSLGSVPCPSGGVKRRPGKSLVYCALYEDGRRTRQGAVGAGNARAGAQEIARARL